MIRLNGPALAVAALCFHFLIPNAAQAQSYSEVPYAPEVGSRWSVVSVTDGEEIKPGSQTVNQKITMTSEFTVEEKLPVGYRVTYAMRDFKIEGNAPAREMAQTAFSAMKGVVVRGRINASGKPVAVDNFDEVKVSVNKVVDSLAKGFADKPQLAGFLRQMLTVFLDVDSARAPEVYMEDMTPLAAGQTTGIVPGAVKREDNAVPTPFGASVKSALETRIESFDNAAGKVRYIRKQAFDKESLKTVTLAMTEKLVAASGNKQITPEIMAQMKDVRFDLQSEAVITVEGGMTRKIDDRSVTEAQLMGHIMRKTEKKVMTVTRVN
ncbi:MAG: hypothetical protein Q7T81_17670 [Pseudolabrys sp.]|nr:hypothetical protein [Pseudolabrys sp.]